MPLVDFHSHLTESGGYAALPPASDLFGPSPVVAVTNRPSDWRAMAGSSGRRPVVWALGLHPEIRHDTKAVDAFLAAVPASEMIGEIGLDGSSHALAPLNHQADVLSLIVADPQVSRRLVSLHSRGAATQLLSILASNRLPGAILHWFLGTAANIDAAIDLDVFFSVNEAMLTGSRGRDVVRALPPNRVVLETDAPYGGPGKTLASPGDLKATVERLSRLWQRDIESATALIESNQRHLLARVPVVPPVLASATI